MQARYSHVAYLDYKSCSDRRAFSHFLRPPSFLRPVEEAQLTAESVDLVLDEDQGLQAAVLLTSLPEAETRLEALAGSTTQARCSGVNRSGSLIDRMLYSMNPNIINVGDRLGT